MIERERSFTDDDRRGAELRAEIDRRLAVQEKRRGSINTIAAVIGAVVAIGGIAISLDRGIYIGSTMYTITSNNKEEFVHRTCRYLFITGIAELDASGGIKEVPGYAYAQPRVGSPTESSLHCHLFAS